MARGKPGSFNMSRVSISMVELEYFDYVNLVPSYQCQMISKSYSWMEQKMNVNY